MISNSSPRLTQCPAKLLILVGCGVDSEWTHVAVHVVHFLICWAILPIHLGDQSVHYLGRILVRYFSRTGFHQTRAIFAIQHAL